MANILIQILERNVTVQTGLSIYCAQGLPRFPSAHGIISPWYDAMICYPYGWKTKKIELDPYKNPFLTDPIPENAVLNRTFYDVIRLKDQKFCFGPYRIAQKYGYRWENRVLNRTDVETGAKKYG